MQMKRIVLLSLLICMSAIGTLAVRANAQGMTGAEYGRLSQAADKKNQKLARKAAKRQVKLSRKAVKRQQKALKKEQRKHRKH